MTPIRTLVSLSVCFFLKMSIFDAVAQTAIPGATTSSTITIGPTGRYRLTGDIRYTGTQRAIGFAANSENVTLDLNGFSVISTNNAIVGINTYVVTSSLGSNNVVRNGSIIGFKGGIDLGNESGAVNKGGHIIENIRVVGQQDPRFGIRVFGDGSIVRDCIVRNIKDTGDKPLVYGIGCYGEGTLVSNCDVQNITSTAIGGIVAGIYFNSTASRSMAISNRITGSHTGIYFSDWFCRFRDNITGNDVTVPYHQGDDVANND